MRSATPTGPPVPTAEMDGLAGQVTAVRLDEQHRRLPLSQATVVISSALVAAVVGWAPPVRIWLAAVLTLVALRLAGWAARRRRPDAFPPKRWELLHVAGAAANGLLWAAVPVLLFAPGHPAERMFLTAVLVGMVAGSAASTLGHSLAFGAFAFPVLACLAYRLLASAEPLERVAAALVVIFGVAMSLLARTTARNVKASLVHRLRNDRLVEQLAVLNAALEETIRLRTGELVELERRLAGSALLASVGSLTAAVAHDINNPLASLMSSLRLVEEEARDGLVTLTPAAREALEDAGASAARVAAIVRSLGEVARDEARPTSLGVCEILDSCLQVAAPELRGRVRVVRDLPGAFRILGERGSLSRMFLGLILQLARRVPPASPPTHELRIAVAPPAGAIATVEITCFPPPPVDERGGEDGPSLSPFHAAIARLGGRILVRPDGSGFEVTLAAHG